MPVPHQNKDINNPWFLWCLWDQTLQCRVYAMPPLHTKTKKNIYIHSSYGVYETQILHTLYSVECMLCPRFTPKQKQKYISMVPMVSMRPDSTYPLQCSVYAPAPHQNKTKIYILWFLCCLWDPDSYPLQCRVYAVPRFTPKQKHKYIHISMVPISCLWDPDSTYPLQCRVYTIPHSSPKPKQIHIWMSMVPMVSMRL